MDSLQDLLGKYRREEPEEITLIKQYVEEHFHAPAGVAVQGEALVITVQSAALANTLRLHTLKLRALCPDVQRFIFRIS